MLNRVAEASLSDSGSSTDLRRRFVYFLDPVAKESRLGTFFVWSILVFIVTLSVDLWLILWRLVPFGFFDPFRTAAGWTAITLHVTVMVLCLCELKPPPVQLSFGFGAPSMSIKCPRLICGYVSLKEFVVVVFEVLALHVVIRNSGGTSLSPFSPYYPIFPVLLSVSLTQRWTTLLAFILVPISFFINLHGATPVFDPIHPNAFTPFNKTAVEGATFMAFFVALLFAAIQEVLRRTDKAAGLEIRQVK